MRDTPERATGIGGQLLEREVELEFVRSCIDRARAGHGAVVFVEGVAGIGKTRLALAARAIADERGLQTLSARATEFERDFPFGVVGQLFGPVLKNLAPADLDTALAGAAAPARFLVAAPASAADRADDISGTEFGTLNALYWLTANLAERRPVALLVDDAHWADDASLGFLRFLLPRVEDLPVVLLLAARPDDAAPGAARLQSLATDPVTRPLRLTRLSASAVAQVVRGQLAPDADDAFCAACSSASGGNPFLLHQLLAELRATGVVGRADDVTQVENLAPRSVRRTVIRRLERLGEGPVGVARAAAVLGDDVDLRLVAALAGQDASAAREAVDALIRAGIFEAGVGVRFAHPLVRNAVRLSLTPTEVSRQSARAARLLEADGTEPERIAVHLLRTTPRDAPDAAQTLTAAARGALERGAAQPAVAFLRRALAEDLDPATRRDALQMLVMAAIRSNDRAALELVGAHRVAELAADPSVSPEFVFALSLWLHATKQTDEALVVLDRAIDAADGASDVSLALRLEAQRMTIGTRPAGDGRTMLRRRAAGIKRGTADDRLAAALEAYWAAWLGEPAAVCAEWAARALANGSIFTEHPESLPPFLAVWVQLIAEDFDAAETALKFAADDGRQRGSFTAMGSADSLLARLAYARGDVALAAASLADVADPARPQAMIARPTTIGWFIDALVEHEELSSAEELARASLDQGPSDGSRLTASVLYYRGRLRLAQGRVEQAADDLLQAGRRKRAAGVNNPATIPWASTVAPALRALGRADEARALVIEELEQARAWGAAMPLGNALRALGLVDGGGPGLALLREAVDVLERSPAKLEYARALADLGEALRRADAPDAARAPLRKALTIAEAGGAVAIARRAHGALAACGERLAPFMASGRASLTPAETRVARMAADGLSNREIAQALYLSVKTVESHLSNVYRKLAIGSRSELATRWQPAQT